MTDTASATKFHISKKGVIEPCGATVKPCPLGGPSQHFPTREKAEEFLAFEADVNFQQSAARRKSSKTKATWQSDAPLKNVSMDASQRSAREIARMAAEGDVEVDTPYQRGSVWNNEQKVNLIRSMLLGVPIPSIIVNNRGTRNWEAANGWSAYEPDRSLYGVIDGKQRIEAARDWFEGKLQVPASWFDAEVVEHTVKTDDGPYVTYNDLTLTGRRLMNNRAFFSIVEAQLPSIKAEANMYLLVNGAGVAQTDADYDRVEKIANS